MQLRLPSSRPRVTPELVAYAGSRLTSRDRHLCRMLHEHRVVTTAQITELAFHNPATARHRLLALHRLRVVDRFQPHRATGSAPYHYVLDEVGARVLAAEQDRDPAALGYRRDKALALVHSQRLDHLVGVNGFFTALIAHARRSNGRSQLLEWWSERRCAAMWGDIVRPDGYGRWREDARETDFFLEYDRGTEPLDRIQAKLHAYERLQAATGVHTPVLIHVPGPRREANVRAAIQRTPVPHATTRRDSFLARTGPLLSDLALAHDGVERPKP